MNRIFISYRIDDCQDVAGRLDADLTLALGRDAVFRDKTRLVGGEQWTARIDDNARSCRIMLVLIGPDWQTAAFSHGDRKGFPRLSDSEDWVRREIELGLDAGNIVIPVFVNGATMPSEKWLASCGLGRLHGKLGARLSADDYEAHLAALLTAIATQCPELSARASSSPRVERRDFYRHIALPPNYVLRGPLLAELMSVVLSDHQTIALTSAMPSRPSALHGMGGVGKSVLARALCEQADVRAAFPDGILWATLGQTPDLKVCLRDWLGALGVTVPGAAPTVTAMAEALAGALEPRACLLVVDDLWLAEHLRPFTVIGPRCRLLVTTRDAALARQFGARIHPVHAMARDEALRLLEAWADGHLADVAAPTREAILGQLGGLPLAVKLAGAQLQRVAGDQWLATFEGIRGLDSGWGAGDRDNSVVACFRLSMDALDSKARRLYSGLGIFREDELIPIAAITRLWSEWGGATPQEARRLCYALADRALVELAPGGEALILHDFIRDMTVELLGDQQLDAHRSILAAYARTRSGPTWPTAADDGYLHDHLAYHLASARDVDGLRRLFEDDRWMWARLRRGDHRLDGYLSDLDRFWGIAMSTADGQIAADEAPEALVDCMTCALIQTTLNTGARTYPPDVLARAVELGEWSLERALSTLNRIPEAGRRLDCLVALLGISTLTPEMRQRVSEIALAAASGHDAVRQLGRLASCVDDAHVPRILSRMLSADLESRDVMDLPGAVAAILPRTDQAQRLAILEVAATLPAEYGAHTPCHSVLAILAPHVPDSHLLQALRLALEATSKGRIAAIAALFPRIDAVRRAELLAAAWDEALAMPAVEPPGLSSLQTNIRAWGLAQLAPFASAERRREASALCLHDLRAMHDSGDIRNVVKVFAPWFELDDLPGVLDVVRALPETNRFGGLPRVEAVAHLADRLDVAGIHEPIEQSVTFLFHDGWGMGRLAPSLSPSWRTRCVARLVGEPCPAHVHLAAPLLPHLGPREKAEVIRAYPMRDLLRDELVDWRRVACDLPPDLFGDLVDAMIDLPDEGGMSSRGGRSGFYSRRELRLMAVASRLSPEQVQRCVNARGRTRDELSFVESVVRLLPVIPAHLRAIDLALATVLRMPEESEATRPAREVALAVLAAHLSVDQRTTCLHAIERGSFPLTQIFGLAALLPHLQGELREQALASARSRLAAFDPEDPNYFPALAAVVPFLPDSERPLAAEQSLARLRPGWVGNEEALETVIPFLEPAALRGLVRYMQELTYSLFGPLPQILRLLVPHLTGSEIQELAEDLGSRTVEYPAVSKQSHCLARLQLVSHLDEEHGQPIIAAVFDEIRDRSDYYPFHGEIYAQILEYLPADCLTSALDVALGYDQRSRRRIGALRALIPRLDPASRARAMDVFLADVLALDGLDAIVELDAGFQFLTGSSDHRRLMRRELVSRLHAGRNADRVTVLRTLASSHILSEALLPRSVLSAIATKLLEVYSDWTWP